MKKNNKKQLDGLENEIMSQQ